MEMVASRELRNDTRGVLRKVEEGGEVTITVDGRPAAVLRPVAAANRWMASSTFVRLFVDDPADRELLGDINELTGAETTDDLRW